MEIPRYSVKFPKISRFNDLLRFDYILVLFERYEENIALAISRINDGQNKYEERRDEMKIFLMLKGRHI